MKPTQLLVLAALLSALEARGEVIRVGLAMPKDLPGALYVNGIFERFKSEVETNSNGALKVQIYYGGVLGKPDERLNQMRRNVIQMTDSAEGNYATIYRDIQVFSIPYLFPSTDIAHRVLDGPVGLRVAEGVRQKTGIRILGWWEAAGFKHYSANSPIRDPQDIKGKKIRVMSAVFSIPIDAMGGAGIPIPMNELYISLKTGVVDGQENAVAVFNMQKLYEVQKFMLLDSHVYSFGGLGINDAFFESLDEDKQRVILNAGRSVLDWNRAVARDMEAEALELARSKGVTIITVLPQDRERFAERTQPAVIDWLRSNMDTPELIDEVLKEARRVSGLRP